MLYNVVIQLIRKCFKIAKFTSITLHLQQDMSRLLVIAQGFLRVTTVHTDFRFREVRCSGYSLYTSIAPCTSENTPTVVTRFWTEHVYQCDF